MHRSQWAVAGLLLAAQSALGQVTPDNRLVATVSVSADHVETSRSSGRDESGLILLLRPGVSYNSRTGRLRGSLNYFAELQHDSASTGTELSHSLDAALTAEAVENWLYVDATATASQRAVSAFGLQVVDPSSPRREDGNQEDVFTGRLRPHVRGILGGLVSYNAGVYTAASRTRDTNLGDVNENGADVALASIGGGLFGWGLNGTHQRVEFLAGRATVDQRVIASLHVRPDVDWLLTVRGGQESTDVASIDKRRYDNWGAGLRWTPSPRTLLSADVDERYFGRSWALVLEHRFSRSALRLTSTRGASSSGGAAGGSGITAYQLLMSQYASAQPDEALRDLLVRDVLRFLGIEPGARVPGGSLSNAISLQRRTDLGWTYTAVRFTVALQAFSGDTQTLDTLAPQLGDGPVSQRGLVATVGWRLSPTARANLTVSHLHTADNSLRPGNDLNALNLSVSEQIGPFTTASITSRLSRQSGGPDPYRETAIGAALSHRF